MCEDLASKPQTLVAAVITVPTYALRRVATLAHSVPTAELLVSLVGVSPSNYLLRDRVTGSSSQKYEVRTRETLMNQFNTIQTREA